ncbi:hypothetical protein Q3G72_015180 [Acer saccharum]|nr:hypothetical protein Q3G72_015180 [Acer saccharum]
MEEILQCHISLITSSVASPAVSLHLSPMSPLLHLTSPSSSAGPPLHHPVHLVVGTSRTLLELLRTRLSKSKKTLAVNATQCASYGQRPEGEKNFSEPCCHSRHHHRTATVAAAAFERPVVASAAEEPIRTGSDDRAAFVASTITPFLVELHLTDGDATIVSVGRFAAEIG